MLRRLLGLAAAMLLAAYVLPLFWPPPLSTVVEPGLWGRLFPGVPTAWVVGRLVALGIGAVLFGLCAASPVLPATLPRRPAPPPPPRLVRIALYISLIHVAVGFFAAYLPRFGQAVYMLALGLPAMVLAFGDSLQRRQWRSTVEPRQWLGLVAVVVLWCVWRVPLVWRSARAASLVDMWHNFSFFTQAAADGSNLLTGGAEVAVSNAYLLALGISFVGPYGFEPSFVWVQAFHCAWLVASAVGVWCLVRRPLGSPAALVATAGFLFSPLALMLPMSAAPFGLMTALVAALLLSARNVWLDASMPALAALGGLIGFSMTMPQMVPAGVAIGVATAGVVLWRRDAPNLVWAIAVLSAVAGVLPFLMHMPPLSELTKRYVDLRGEWLTLEQLLFGQLRVGTNQDLWKVWQAGKRGSFDVPLGALLAPFAIPRTALRLVADSLFEPISAALAAVGVALCVRTPRSNVAARFLVAALMLSLLPGMLTSAYDRASLTRNMAMPVLLAMLAGVGFQVVTATALRGIGNWTAAVLFSGLIVGAGTTLFDRVTPPLLATSWLEISLDALDGARPAGGVVVLEHGSPRRWDWQHIPRITANLSRPPLPTVAYVGPESLAAAHDASQPLAELVLWSPGLEADASVSAAICARWPGAELYRLHDLSGTSTALAARPGGYAWQPSLPPQRWSHQACSELGETSPARREPR